MPPRSSAPPELVDRQPPAADLDALLSSLLDERRIRLLEAIGRHGSIAKAARAVPMSYRGAWDALDAMSSLTAQPVVESTVGGRLGGGTQLTPHGRRLVALYRAAAQVYQQTLDRLSRQWHQAGDTDEQAFHALPERVSLRTSARNGFVGTLVQITSDEGGAEATVQLQDATRITALLTRDSAEALALRPGSEVHALVKASAVLLGTGRGLRTSAANQLWGQVTRIDKGPAQADVTLDLQCGPCLAALITNAGLRHLDLRLGDEACAVFQASSVILATCI